MPVPKRKVSKSRRDSRQANKGLKVKTFAECANCSGTVMPHQACLGCGFYKGKKVLETKADRQARRDAQKKAKLSKKEAAAAQDTESVVTEPTKK